LDFPICDGMIALHPEEKGKGFQHHKAILTVLIII
jgi:hypothetical protein